MQEVPEYDEFVPDPQVRKELGGVTIVTTWRWDQNPEKAPNGWLPPVRIGRRNFRPRKMIEEVKANLIRQSIERGGKAA